MIFGTWYHTAEVGSHTSQWVRSYDRNCAVVIYLDIGWLALSIKTGKLTDDASDQSRVGLMVVLRQDLQSTANCTSWTPLL